MSREAMKQPEALQMADDLDHEFTQGRISNYNGRKAAVELRRLALKQWVGLTDEEHDNIKRNYHNMTWTLEMFARAIEQALKEKNHG